MGRQSAATSPPSYFQQPPVNPFPAWSLLPCSFWVSCRSPVLSPSPAGVGATWSFSAQSGGAEPEPWGVHQDNAEYGWE